ncbi:MAG: N-acetyltransferase family protein [Blastocatellia bacterium]
MPETLVRPATAADSRVFLDMLCEFARYEGLEPPDQAGQERLLHDAFGSRPRFAVLLAESDGQMAGYAIIYEIYSSFLARPKLYLEDLYVRPAFRGAGIGRALFQACVRETEKRGYDRLQWYVESWNDRAMGFYEQLGGRKLGWQTWQMDCRGADFRSPDEPKK